jgi:hypothetical protein
MLAQSNYCLSGIGQDIDPTLLKCALFQFYMFSPWLAVPIWWLGQTDLLLGNTSEAYLDFLQLILKIVQESDRNPQIVYSCCKDNLDKLDEFLAHILQAWALSTLPQADPEIARAITEVIVSFCILLRQFPLGDKASHLEIIITGHEIASNVFTRREFPRDWGIAQNNLGNAYLYRIHGDRAENLEIAIAYFRRALQVRTREAFRQVGQLLKTTWAKLTAIVF